MPIFATVFMIVTFSSIGLPGTNGFVGEFLVLVGAFESELRWWTIVASSGVILSAVYMLWVFQRVMFGELDNPKNQKLLDLNAREIGIMVPLIVMIFVMGLYPKPFIDKMDPSIKKLVAQVRTAVPMDVQKAVLPIGHHDASQGQELPAGHQDNNQGMPPGHPGSEQRQMTPAGHPGAAPVAEQHKQSN
jgi:NADH-quinone oxidoreductase subunit M